jgi:hypothetical protein
MAITAKQRRLILGWIALASATFGSGWLWNQAMEWYGSPEAARAALVTLITGRGAAATSPGATNAPAVSFSADSSPPPAGPATPSHDPATNAAGGGSAPVSGDGGRNEAINEPVDLSRAVWVGRASGAKAVAPSVVATGGRVSGGRVTFECPRPGWPRKVVRGKTCDGGIVIAWERADGTWLAGFFDWVKPGQPAKDFANLAPGGEFDPPGTPPQGARVTFCLVSTDWRRRSTSTPPVRWP